MSARVLEALSAVLNYGDEHKLCRCCGFDYVHIEAIAVKQGGKITTISSKRVVTSKCPNNRRGSDVAIEYRCEQGCSFVEVVSFHKGNVFEVCVEFDRNRNEPIDELWRD